MIILHLRAAYLDGTYCRLYIPHGGDLIHGVLGIHNNRSIEHIRGFLALME